jgi:hypothetical protein
MTRAQRLREADALLCAAKHWQNGNGRDACCRYSNAVFECYVFVSDLVWMEIRAELRKAQP